MATTALTDESLSPGPLGPVAGRGRPARLAVLVAAPHRGECAMHNDILAIVPVLRSRGFCDDELLRLDEGELERKKVLDFLREAAHRVSSWKEGEVILYVTGHGGFTGYTLEEARPAVILSEGLPPLPVTELVIFWDEIFSTLDLPARVNLTLLADT